MSETTERTYTIETPMGTRTVDFAVWDVVANLDEAQRLLEQTTMLLLEHFGHKAGDEELHILVDYGKAWALVMGARGSAAQIDPGAEVEA